MSSKVANPIMQSAAWRISLWASLAFAIGTMIVFAMLHQFVAADIQRRSDAWLSGEVGVLGDVAARTPKDRLYSRVVGEVAELASREVQIASDKRATRTMPFSSFRPAIAALPSYGSAQETGSQTSLPSAPLGYAPMCPSMCGSKVSSSHSELLPCASRTGATSIWGYRNETNFMS